MYDVIRNPVARVSLILALSAGSLGIAGCANSSLETTSNAVAQTPNIPINPTLQRCFSDPQPSATQLAPEVTTPGPIEPTTYKQESQTQIDSQDALYKKQKALYLQAEMSYLNLTVPPLLSRPMVNDYPIGDPILPSKQLIDKIDEGIVQVSNPEGRGSGFLTSDPEGRQVVITAAHVTDADPINTLQITNNNGVTETATGGCYLYENIGSFVPPTKFQEGQSFVDTDIAVLTIAAPLGTSLPINTQPASRGEYDYLSNYQAYNQPGDPSLYAALIAQTPPYESLNFIAGLHQLPSNPTLGMIASTEIEAGASGGLVINQTGLVDGVSVSSSRNFLQDNAGYLNSHFQVAFPQANYGIEGGFLPDDGTAMPSSLIRKILSAPSA